MNRQPELWDADEAVENGRPAPGFMDRNVGKVLILLKKSTDYRMLQLK